MLTDKINWEKIISGNPHSFALGSAEEVCEIYLGFYDVIRVYSPGDYNIETGQYENFDASDFDEIEVIGYVEDMLDNYQGSENPLDGAPVLSGGVGPYYIGNYPNSYEGQHLNLLKSLITQYM